jgi:teichuronic acid biosynthesis glycosyltransferase TuaC
LKVLFVCSGNTAFGISPITREQGNSLAKCGINISYFALNGKGMMNYLKNAIALKKHLKVNKYDIIHAHYSLTAFVASISGARPMIVSLMGSDSKTSKIIKFAIKFLNRYYWKHCIVKSEDMRTGLQMPNVSVLPNGVNTEIFYPRDKATCCNALGWDLNKTHILFAAKPTRPEKNFSLALQAFHRLDAENSELHKLIDVSPDQMPIWINASDVVLLTSLWEGSPNVIKEAMACNRPIVSTDVGDVNWLFGQVPGFYLCNYSPQDVAEKTILALNYSKKYNKTNGLDRIIELKLDSKNVAQKIQNIYLTVLNKDKLPE